MNIIKISSNELNKKEMEKLLMNKKNAICIVDENGEENVVINKKELAKILVDSEEANEFARDLILGQESYEEVLDSIDKQIEDPNTVYYSHEEAWKIIRDNLNK